jgi:hypothetical protein
MFGFGFDGGSVAAGVVATALAFGLVPLSLACVLGPVSGCHVNPAVTTGALLAGRISVREAVGYWTAQFAGGIAGAHRRGHRAEPGLALYRRAADRRRHRRRPAPGLLPG